MTYEEGDVFAIAFLKGAASVDDVMNEAAMSEEEAMLKPCPFCGSKAFLCYTTDNKAMPYIKCGNLNSTGINTECYAQQQPWRYKTADEAAEAWNRRDI